MTLQRINPESIGIKVTIDGTEWIIFYNQTNGKLERFLLGDNIEITNNKATDFSIINDIKYPTTKAVNDQKGIADGLASLDADGLLDPTQIPPIAITKVVIAVETTISAFAANSGNYTFEQGDVILIDDSGDIQHYLFKGGDKTDVNEYSLINATEITISQVIGLQSALDDKASLTNNQTFTGNNTFTGATTSLNSSNINVSGVLNVLSNEPVIVLKDINSTGANQFAFLSFRDMNNLETGWIGFGDTGNTDLNIRNTMGNVTIQNYLAYHAGNLDINAIVYRTGNQIIAGDKSFADFASTTKTIAELDAGADNNFVTKDWVEANSGGETHGTFTPTLVDAGGGATYSVSTTTGNYIKTANMVHFSIIFNTISTSGTPTGILQINGMPFDQDFVNIYNVVVQGGDVSFSSIQGKSLGSSSIAFRTSDTDSSTDNAGFYSSVTFTSGVVEISGVYFTGF